MKLIARHSIGVHSPDFVPGRAGNPITGAPSIKQVGESRYFGPGDEFETEDWGVPDDEARRLIVDGFAEVPGAAPVAYADRTIGPGPGQRRRPPADAFPKDEGESVQ